MGLAAGKAAITAKLKLARTQRDALRKAFELAQAIPTEDEPPARTLRAAILT
jgi:hypothetical protein